MKKINIKDPILIEIAITAIVAVILLFLHQYELMIVATSLQILMTLMTYAIPLRIKRESYDNIDDYFKILKLSMSIEDEPFKNIKDKIIKDCENQLELLKRGGVKGEVYYSWLDERVRKSEKNIKAISSMDCDQWEDNPKELAYYKSNRIARITRDCNIERIFIVDIHKLENKKNRKIIVKHLLDNIQVYILSQGRIFSEGMCIFDDKLILVDDIVPPKGVGGRLIKSDNEDFAEKAREYDRIKLGSRLIEDLDRLSEVINIEVKMLLDESCGIIKETCSVKVFEELERKIRDKPDDKIQIYYYERWKNYCKILKDQSGLNE